ncbi:hypothetical protein EAX62_06520 [Tessaracoccus antarcticus]|uniref:Uncharacterized protein n=1 Tax=Tessaracoccus antarcticus TaxID=2479848 RepID=A0A3M0GHS9_9ACTN|nr:hypothetical protein EAX62_06520 [Tessaracoccus antarcticus]
MMRWAVCVWVLTTVAVLSTGWRRHSKDGARTRLATGAATGLVGGATGLTGPLAVLLHLSGRDGAERTRANIAVFLSLLSVLMPPLRVLSEVLGPLQASIGLALLPGYALTTAVRQALFRPGNERFFRVVAHVAVAAAGVAGMPVRQ